MALNSGHWRAWHLWHKVIGLTPRELTNTWPKCSISILASENKTYELIKLWITGKGEPAYKGVKWSMHFVTLYMPRLAFLSITAMDYMFSQETKKKHWNVIWGKIFTRTSSSLSKERRGRARTGATGLRAEADLQSERSDYRWKRDGGTDRWMRILINQCMVWWAKFLTKPHCVWQSLRRSALGTRQLLRDNGAV